MSGIYVEENSQYRIDLRKAIWSKGDLHDMYKYIGNILSDVDFMAETDDEMFLIEYKNTEIENAQNPEAFNEKVKNGRFHESILKKYYGSIFFVMASEKMKPIHFVCVLESKLMDDSVLRKRMGASIKKRLPFELQKNPEIAGELIAEFKLLTVIGMERTLSIISVGKTY